MYTAQRLTSAAKRRSRRQRLSYVNEGRRPAKNEEAAAEASCEDASPVLETALLVAERAAGRLRERRGASLRPRPFDRSLERWSATPAAACVPRQRRSIAR